MGLFLGRLHYFYLLLPKLHGYYPSKMNVQIFFFFLIRGWVWITQVAGYDGHQPALYPRLPRVPRCDCWLISQGGESLVSPRLSDVSALPPHLRWLTFIWFTSQGPFFVSSCVCVPFCSREASEVANAKLRMNHILSLFGRQCAFGQEVRCRSGCTHNVLKSR